MRDKIKRFADIAERFNVICPEKEVYDKIKGKWRGYQFSNDNDVVLELACGRGEYTVGLAKVFKNRNFVGIDIKGDRIWVGSTQAQDEDLKNAAFLRTQIQFLSRFFEKGEVSEVWITFPDPRPKVRDEKHRLTNHFYLDIYKEILKDEGFINFKTDNTFLFDYSLSVLSQRKDIKNLVYTRDLYNSPYNDLHHGIKTKYEQKFYDLGENIKFLKFQFA